VALLAAGTPGEAFLLVLNVFQACFLGWIGRSQHQCNKELAALPLCKDAPPTSS
jgi:hypothetical protein